VDWERFFGAAGAALALVAVALGAFAAHALSARLEPRALEVFETGVRYHLTHALALVLVAVLLSRSPGAAGGSGTAAVVAGWLFLGGIVVFSGSLYLLATTGVGRWGAVTPLGGVAFLAGWGFLLAFFLRG
jgi:uncharacterized membrane protein YgdD (TMEM256/DUF423 family)